MRLPRSPPSLLRTGQRNWRVTSAPRRSTQRRMKRIRLIALAAALALPACAAQQAETPPHRTYVAMGSSFAAGPGIAPMEQGGELCRRSLENYPNQLARKRDLMLIDASCGGATTANLLEPWGKIPAQVDALTRETQLVTVTIGGNDVGYIGGLMGAACRNGARDSAMGGRCIALPEAGEAAWQGLEERLGRIASEVRSRSPRARLIFVEYPAIAPQTGTCPALGLTRAEADKARALAVRLAALTTKVARANGADVLHADRLSRGHDACAARPWMNGAVLKRKDDGMVFHPNRAGMAAQAAALDRMLGRR